MLLCLLLTAVNITAGAHTEDESRVDNKIKVSHKDEMTMSGLKGEVVAFPDVLQKHCGILISWFYCSMELLTD